MSSWVYLISKFTPEMLFLESVVILSLLGSYAAFWVIRKRKHGATNDVVPAGVVKEYLNELIREANQMRTTMFGILSAAGVQMTEEGSMPALGAGVAIDPSIFKKVGELESKMSEQAKAMQAIAAEKARIEKELAAAKAAGAAAGDSAPKDDGLIDELKRRISLLEGKLAEYSVIEDDLANLKKLQQENAQLRAALGEGKTEAVAAAPAPVPAPAPAPKPAAAAAPAPKVEEASFEGLVDKVEESLQEEVPAAAAAAPAAPEPEPDLAEMRKEMLAEAPASMENAEPVATQAAAAGDADADLVAEFEKMLNS